LTKGASIQEIWGEMVSKVNVEPQHILRDSHIPSELGQDFPRMVIRLTSSLAFFTTEQLSFKWLII
jgi:hypothetical protein